MSRIAIFFTLIAFFHVNLSHAEVRIFLPNESFNQVKVQNGDGDSLFEGEVSLPYSPYLNPNIPRIKFPHIYNFENSQGDIQTWEVLENQSPVFYVRDTLKRHFVRNPLVYDGRVAISNPETGQIYISTITDSSGSFEVAATSIPSDAPEYLKISISGGVALFKPRSEDNVMAMLVRKDSFFRGSLTISMSGTAAYLAAKKQIEYGNIGISDFYELYTRNLRKISGGFLLPLGIEADEAAYLNVIDEAPIEPLPFTTEESVNLVLFDGVTIIDIMTSNYDEQYEHLREFFGEMDGWEDYWHKLNRKSLSGWPVQLEIQGESSVNVTIEKLNGTHVSTKNYQGKLISEHSSAGPQYLLPKIIVKNDERIKLELNPEKGWSVFDWNGCSDEDELTCVVARDAYEPNVLLLKYEPELELDKKPELARKVELSLFEFSGDTFIGKSGYDITRFFFVASLSFGDIIEGEDGVFYKVLGTEVPSHNDGSSEASQFKIKVKEEYHPKYNSYEPYLIESNLDVWKAFVDNSLAYEEKSIIPIHWDEKEAKGVGFFLGESSGDVFFGQIIKMHDGGALLSSNNESIQPTCISGNLKTSKLYHGAIDLSATYKVCSSPDFSYQISNIEYRAFDNQPTDLGNGRYTMDVDLKGELILSVNGQGKFEALKLPVGVNPTFKAEINTDIESLLIGANAKDIVQVDLFKPEQPLMRKKVKVNIGEKLKNPKNYRVSMSEAGSPGSVEAGFSLVGSAVVAEAFVGVFGAGSVKEVPVPNKMCGVDNRHTYEASVDLVSKFGVQIFGKSFDGGIVFTNFYKKKFTPDSPSSGFECPRLMVEKVDGEIQLVVGYNADNTAYYLLNNTDYYARVKIKESNPDVTLSPTTVGIMPGQKKAINISPVARNAIIFGGGAGKVDSIVETKYIEVDQNYILGEVVSESKDDVVVRYLVDKEAADLVMIPLTEVDVSEYSFGMAQIKRVGLKSRAYGGGAETLYAETNQELKSIIKTALRNRILQLAYGEYYLPISEFSEYNLEDIEIDESLISITSRYVSENKNVNISNRRVYTRKIDRIGDDFALSGLPPASANRDFGVNVMVEYADDGQKFTNIYPDFWFYPEGNGVDRAEIYNTPLLKDAIQNATTSLTVDYRDKYFHLIEATKECSYINDTPDNITKLEGFYGVMDSRDLDYQGKYAEKFSAWDYYYDEYNHIKVNLMSMLATSDENGDFHSVFNFKNGTCTLSGSVMLTLL